MLDKLPPWLRDTRLGLFIAACAMGVLVAAWYFDRQSGLYKDRIAHLEKENDRVTAELRDLKTGVEKQVDAATTRGVDASKQLVELLRDGSERREEEYKAFYAAYSSLLSRCAAENSGAAAERHRLVVELSTQEQQLRTSITMDQDSISRLQVQAAQYKESCSQHRNGTNWHLVSESDCQRYDSFSAEADAMKARIALKERDLRSVQGRLTNDRRQ